MAKKMIQARRTNRNNHKIKKETRRNPIKKNKSHWKFKNSHKSIIKFNQKQAKAIKSKKESSIKKEETEIQLIENENELFDDKGYYNNQSTAEEDKGIEWDDEHNDNPPNTSDLFGKMDEVNEKKLEPKVIEAYKLLGEILRKYTSGKLPKAFTILPSIEDWEELINITDPFNWTPQVMYEATILFSSGFNPLLAERFYVKYLLPAIRNDIKVHKKLNIHYYNSLKKALFKPAAFFKGLILPLSKSLNEKEAAIFGSIMKKCSIPMIHASAAIMKLLQSCKEGRQGVSIGALFFIKLLLVKKYAMPEQVKEGLIQFFCYYKTYNGQLPVMWHQLLLIFVQGYKLDLKPIEKTHLKELITKKSHHLISDEIAKELNYVHNKVVVKSDKMSID